MSLRKLRDFLALNFLNLPGPIISLLAGKPIQLDNQVLDRQTQLLLRLVALVGEKKSSLTLEQCREEMDHDTNVLSIAYEELPKVENRKISNEERDIPIRLYYPQEEVDSLPLIVFYHGGGWTVGSLDSHDYPCRALAKKANAIVVSVDYRLAPENKFPAGFNDATKAYRWVVENASHLGGDPQRIAVAGDSAGGNLAAAVSQEMTKAKEEFSPIYQLLIYPATNLYEEEVSMETFSEGFYLTREDVRWYKEQYIHSKEEAKNPQVSPLLALKFENLPPAFVVTAGFDPLRDEGKFYAEAMRNAGVKVRYKCYPGLIHGFFSTAGGIRQAKLAFDEIAQDLHTALHS